MMENLAGKTGRQQDALRTMVQESVGAYMDFLNSAFFYSQRGLDDTKEAAREARGQRLGREGSLAPPSRKPTRTRGFG